MDDSAPTSVLLLCHDGGWDRLYQAASCAATFTSMGSSVDLVFYFGALDKLLSGRLDEIELEPRDEARERRLRDSALELGTRPVSELLAAARDSGRVRLFACSASTALLGYDPTDAAEKVDEIIGWPTVARLMQRAGQRLYL